ncbi:MAG: tRNA (adenosine(37)-N6)-threonylcarbamoyltransferase complex dimerization subunit type 1 TsaB [Clostridia bacterium]
MNILSLNTAFKNAQIVLDCNGKIFEETFSACSKHSENVLVGIDAVLNRAKISVEEIDFLACVIGPGSFTGIRIGVATIKGFVVACEKIKCIKMTSLELIAKEYFSIFKNEKQILAVMNGLSNNFFVAQYDSDLKEIISPEMTDSDGLANLITKNKKFACSDEDADFFKVEHMPISTNVIASLARERAEKNETISESQLIPLYLRLSQAEQDLIDKAKK